MENRKYIKIFLVLALLNTFSLTIPGRVFGYEIQTHAGITKEAVEFYNQHFPNRKFSADEARIIIAGSVSEDDAPRWFNHYYDPIYNRGLTNPALGGEGKWLSSKVWSQNGAAQIAELYNPIMLTTAGKLALLTDPEQITASDYTWERALRDYASGDVVRGLRGLGQVVHLIEDASVPDHTRNDTHIALEGVGGLFGQGSPYELWTNQFDEQTTELSPFLYLKKPVLLPTLDEYFDSMALYSNKNFYSKDTIDSPEYTEPKPDYKLKIGEVIFGFKKDFENGDYRLVGFKAKDKPSEFLAESQPTLESEDDSIMRDYWERLAPKAVQHAAGLMDLFFREAEKLKNNPSFAVEKKQSFLGQVIDAVKGFFEKQTNGGFETLAEVDLEDIAINKGNPSTSSGTKDQKEIAASSGSRVPTGHLLKGDNDNQDSLSTGSGNKKGEIASLQKSPTPPSPLERGRKGEAPNFDLPEGKMTNSLKQENKKTQKPEENTATSTVTLREDASAEQASSPAVVATEVCQYGNPSASSGDKKIVINEIAWAGTEASPSDEWFELRNIGGATVALDGYQLVDKGDQIHLTFPAGTNLASGAYLLLERTNDGTIPNIPADFIYVGALGNDDEGLRLFDKNCALLDEAMANPEWLAGSTNPRRTMERQSDFSWRTYSGSGEGGIFGTPRAGNTESQGGPSTSSGTNNSSPSTPPAGGSGNVEEDIAAPPPPPPAAELARHIVISEVSAGIDGNAEYEFVELYNPTDTAVDMAGWSLKKKSSSGATTTLVSAGAFSGTIAPKSFFLIAHPEYTGAKTADRKYSAASQNLAYTNNAAVLYDAGGVKVDEMSWTEIEKGQSLERKAVGSPSTSSGTNNLGSGGCVSPQGGGAYLGNGCDTDAAIDFESRITPDPQNKNSLPEPREKPSAASDFDVRFYPATMKAAFSWATTTDATGSTTQTYIIEGVASTTVAGYVQAFNEVGRDYSYSISVKDRDGLAGDTVIASTNTPSFIKEIKFFNNPVSASEKLLDIYFNEYPFVPTVFTTTPNLKILTFNLNGPAQKEPRVDTPMNWEPENKAGLLAMQYPVSSGPSSLRRSLILPAEESQTCCGGVANSAHHYGRITEDKMIRLRVSNADPLINADYVSLAYYDFAGGGAGNQTFDLLATDGTKFYFSATGTNAAPGTPQKLFTEYYATSTKKLIVSWGRSIDPDGSDLYVEYQLNTAVASTSAEAVFEDANWQKPWLGSLEGSEIDHSNRVHTTHDVEEGKTYIFAVRGIDEFGATSSVAVSEPYLVPIAAP